jgi:translocation and assembly module TamB
LDDGDFSVEGNFELDRFVPSRVDLQLTTHILPIIIPDVMEMQINANLKMAGTPEQSRLSGAILLLEGRYSQDVKFSLIDAADKMDNRHRQNTFRSQSLEYGLPFFNHLSLDLDLTSRNPFVVDNNLALLHIQPILHIQGSVTDPVATGRIEVTEGTISYRDTDFEVKEGAITFINPYRNEPSVSIQAESQVRHWLITLAISGQPENLDIRLTSNPREKHIDILSLLAVGKTTQELVASKDGTTWSPEEMLTNLVAGELGKQLKAETGLDTMELEYRQGDTKAEETDKIKVTVGKELSRRLTVKYGVDMGRKSSKVVQQSTAIYKLLENLSLKAYQDTAGIFGGEVRYRLEFR